MTALTMTAPNMTTLTMTVANRTGGTARMDRGGRDIDAVGRR